MFYKERTEPKELKILDSLNRRIILTEEQQVHRHNLRKGYEGEVMFDHSLATLNGFDCLILNDLLLKVNNNTFQIDSIIITENILYFFEIKNIDGDYIYDSNKFYKIPKIEIVNPLSQLDRAESLLGRLLQNLGFHLKIKGYVVFINPEFTLYQAPLGLPIIFSSQLRNFLIQLKNTPSILKNKNKVLADKLVSQHILDNPYSQLPDYHFDELKKGITCKACHSFNVIIEGRRCFCLRCDCDEGVEEAVLRSVDEFKLLFPKAKVTTNIIFEWCKILPEKKRIQRILQKNFEPVGKNRWVYYK